MPPRLPPPDPDIDATKPRPWLAAALVAVPDGGCAWPTGEIDDIAGFRFCGAPVSASSAHVCRSYCAEHLAKAYLRNGETQEERDASESATLQPLVRVAKP